jgi:hypothetical protein
LSLLINAGELNAAHRPALTRSNKDESVDKPDSDCLPL